MNKICNRRVLVSRYSDNIGVMLSWNEEGQDDIEDMQSKHFHFYNVAVFHKVEEVVNELVNRWGRVFISDEHMATVSVKLDDNPARFDWILENADDSGDVFLHSFERL